RGGGRVRRVAGARGLALLPRLPVAPEYVDSAWIDPGLMPAVLRASDGVGLAREDAWSPGIDLPVPFLPRGALPLETSDELGEEEIVRLFRARGVERQRVFAAAHPRRREGNGEA